MNYIKKLSLIFCSLLLTFFAYEWSQIRETSLHFLDQNGTGHTLSLSIKDKKRLSAFMENLFASDNFAFTILGSKPLSWACCQSPFPFVDWSTFRASFRNYHRTLRLGWKTWEKYSDLFPSVHLWKETPKPYSGWSSILIVNPDHFNAVVNENKKDFQEVLGRKIEDGFQLLDEAKNCSLMDEILHAHQALMGIVLGYGRNNSWKFLEGIEKQEPLGWVWEEMNNPFQEEKPKGLTLTQYNLIYYSCPSFAGEINTEESLALKKNYLLTREKVINYYKGKDFLEATLSLLAGYRPSE